MHHMRAMHKHAEAQSFMNCCMCNSCLGEHSPEACWSSNRPFTHSSLLPLYQCTQVINVSSKGAPAGLCRITCQGCSRQMATCNVALVLTTAAHFQAVMYNRLNGTGSALSVHHVKCGSRSRPDTACWLLVISNHSSHKSITEEAVSPHD